jgi:hypothetical protein
MAFDTDKYTKSPFIKGDDLEEGERTIVTIKTAEEVAFPSGDTVPVLAFLELDQKLTLNKTRVKKCVELLGEDTDDWVGKKIALYPVDVQFNGKTMPGVAIAAPPKKKSAVTTATEKAKPDVKFMDDEEDDENPFA